MPPRIVIADDEVGILETTATLLRGHGYDVTPCPDAERILDTVRRERPDVLLQDLRMPGLDVDRLMADLRATPDLAHLHVILFTASLEHAEAARRLGIRHVIEKPFPLDELIAALEAVGARVTRKE